MREKYDVIIIGAGSAGLGASGIAKSLGLKMLMIEKKKENIGGDCLNFGCVPSKALIHVAKMCHAARTSSAFGLEVSGKIDIEKVMKYIHDKQQVIRQHESYEYLLDQGFEIKIGEAKFMNPDTIQVGEDLFEARIILLCTGSVPRHIDVDGMEHVHVFTNEEIFYEMKTLPEHLLVLGGGPIGCEMAQAFRRLGSRVTIVDRGTQLLSKERPEISEKLRQVFQNEGIDIHTTSNLQKIDSNQNATIKSKDGQISEIKIDAILLAVGRVIRTTGMRLDAAGIQLDDRGKILVDQYLRTTNKRVYALGDAAGTYMFSHGAEKHNRLVWRNLVMPLFRKKDQMKDLSWVTFTDPEIATFGLSQEQMNDKGIRYWRQDQSFESDDRAIVDEYTYGQMSLFVTNGKMKKRRKILAGTMIAKHAGEMIQELHTAALDGTRLNAFFHKVYAYPVGSRMNQKTILGILKGGIASWQKKLMRISFRIWN